jgi:hypothetical protein
VRFSGRTLLHGVSSLVISVYECHKFHDKYFHIIHWPLSFVNLVWIFSGRRSSKNVGSSICRVFKYSRSFNSSFASSYFPVSIWDMYVGLEVSSYARDARIFTVETLIFMYESFYLQDISAGTSDTRVYVLPQLWLNNYY